MQADPPSPVLDDEPSAKSAVLEKICLELITWLAVLLPWLFIVWMMCNVDW